MGQPSSSCRSEMDNLPEQSFSAKESDANEMEQQLCHAAENSMELPECNEKEYFISDKARELHAYIASDESVEKARQLLAEASIADRKCIAGTLIEKSVCFGPNDRNAWLTNTQVFPNHLVFQGTTSDGARACHDALLLAIHMRSIEYTDFLIDECDADVSQEGMLPGLHLFSAGTDLFPLTPEPEPRKLVLFYVKRYPEKATPLWLAAKLGLLSVVSLLASHGADVNYQASNGNTALHSAVVDNNVDVICLLVSLGADVHLTNAAGRTAVDLARQHDMSTIAAYMQQPSPARTASVLLIAGAQLLTHHQRKVQQPSLPVYAKMAAYWRQGFGALHTSGAFLSNPAAAVPGDSNVEINAAYRNAALRDYAGTVTDAQLTGLTVDSAYCVAVRCYEHCCGVASNEVIQTLQLLLSHLSRTEANFTRHLHILRYAVSLRADVCLWAVSHLVKVLGIDTTTTPNRFHFGADRNDETFVPSSAHLVQHLDCFGDVLPLVARSVVASQAEQATISSFLAILNRISDRLTHGQHVAMETWQVTVSQFAGVTLHNGLTLLHALVDITAWSPSIALVKVLLNGGVDINAINSSGDTAVHVTATKTARNPSHLNPRNVLDALLAEPTFHVDLRNSRGQTVQDILMACPETALRYARHEVFNRCQPLQCLAAATARRHNLAFDSLPKRLISFLHLH